MRVFTELDIQSLKHSSVHDISIINNNFGFAEGRHSLVGNNCTVILDETRLEGIAKECLKEIIENQSTFEGVS